MTDCLRPRGAVTMNLRLPLARGPRGSTGRGRRLRVRRVDREPEHAAFEEPMAEIVNLRRARKRKTRAEADAKAAENRTRFGRPKAERDAAAAQARLAERLLAGHRLDEGGDGP